MKQKIVFRLIPLLMAAVFSSACASVRIAQLKSDPSKYQNKTVRVDGRVTNSFGVLSTGFYEIEDDTGKIYVISNRGVPSQGARVSVEGNVFSGATVMGQAVGVAIRESKHKVK
ncbi:MAG: hypothetical protein HY648_08705 [Acidobacteria bacterium]|nr:hypothetical protein [Acidobacteriota bacterium]